MDKSNNFKFRLGLFVITGMALFAAAIFLTIIINAAVIFS